MQLLKTHKNKALVSLFVCMLISGVIFAATSVWSASPKVRQKTFASPEQAVQALVGAMKSGSKKTLSTIFGPESAEWLSSGDPVRDKADRERFLKAYGEKNSLDMGRNDRVILQVGNDDWPFPFPIAKKGSTWIFDSEAGKEELLNRRIGRNELRVLDTMEAYVAGQREYAGKDRTGGGIHAYARRFMSTPGKKDGLYWQAKEGEEESPMGPLVAGAAREGYTEKTRTEAPSPFQGYYFRILTAQGEHAPGGAYDYTVKGNMVLGFGLIAYPAKYGSSGIMTFVVNQEGVVYQKDLGEKTAQAAAAIQKYDPDTTWEKAR
ncbi:DUF2950 domain-containing protein [Syntrophorhabdus aromaticivorans]|jgi:hypothetical protein|uniref:DUF2950 domain-containing protein n=1 Tax=Syntrophorhabdus aromaticivorans TaxID=328301 RepID=A0A971M4H8_9BACT|nr:DUF2950 domain-containing protein [Syntrophorhabdus aromaticivorans]NLW35197.1 DUF2950 domain-containing protein [Syntrophorhabdus aromaticivorans]